MLDLVQIFNEPENVEKEGVTQFGRLQLIAVI
jgi:hypothetical protein